MSPQDLRPNEDGGRGSSGGGWRLVGSSLLPGLHITPWAPPPPNSTLCLSNWAFRISTTTSSDLGATLSFPVERPQHPGSRPHPTRDDEVVGCGHSVQPCDLLNPEMCGCPLDSTSRKIVLVKEPPCPTHFSKMFSRVVPEDSWDICLAPHLPVPVLSGRS